MATNPKSVNDLTSMRPLWAASRRDSLAHEGDRNEDRAGGRHGTQRSRVDQAARARRPRPARRRPPGPHPTANHCSRSRSCPDGAGVAEPHRDQRAERGDRPADTTLEQGEGLLVDDKGHPGRQRGHVDHDHGRAAGPSGQLPVGQAPGGSERRQPSPRARRWWQSTSRRRRSAAGSIWARRPTVRAIEAKQRVQRNEHGVHSPAGPR